MANAGAARLAVLIVVTGTSACAAQPTTEPTTPASSPTTKQEQPSAQPIPETAPVPSTHTVPWVDLAVGDCVTGVPAVDLGEVEVTIIDCGTAHRAEVYLLTDIPVNAALTGVADETCRTGLPSYAADPARYSVTYLIDSRQDRTSNNPLPSTVICLLQAADGTPLTGSARG